MWVRQRKTGKAQCKSECVNMYGPNLIIPHPPGPVIGCLIKAGDERRQVEGSDGGTVGGEERIYRMTREINSDQETVRSRQQVLQYVYMVRYMSRIMCSYVTLGLCGVDGREGGMKNITLALSTTFL